MDRPRPTTFLGALLALCLLAGAPADAGARTEDGTLPAGTPLDWFIGAWDVRLRAAGEADFPARRSFQWQVRPALDGRWLAATVLVDGAVFTHEFAGGDEHGLVRRIFAADGSHVSFRSSGWDGDELLWTGRLVRDGEVLELRERIRRDGDDLAWADYEILEDGRWQPLQTERLDRRQTRN